MRDERRARQKAVGISLPVTPHPADVFKDAVIVHAAVAPVLFTVEYFHITENVADIGQKALFRTLIVKLPAGLEQHADSGLVKPSGKLADPLCAQRRLASREGHAAAGHVVKGLVRHELVKQLVVRHLLSDPCYRLCGADRGAVKAERAALPVNIVRIAERQSARLTDPAAGSAVYAGRGIEGQLCLPSLAFGIVTPHAAQRAALEKHGCAYSGPSSSELPLISRTSGTSIMTS